MWIRTLAWVIGLVAGLLGLAGWIWALSVVLAQGSVSPVTVVFMLVMGLAIAGVAVGAYLHNKRGSGRLWLLVVSTVLLVIGTFLSGFSVGPAFLPAALLAIVATLFTLAGGGRRP